ncbi:MAG: hypothetical protein ABI823_12690 [Bryobacteraceae bacterium]
MKHFHSLIKGHGARLASCALLAASLSTVAWADQWDKKTYVTFSGPVEIPGKVLSAGTYTFRLVDSSSDRNIVQISNERQDHVYATILAIPKIRLNTPEKTIFTFYESHVGQPPPIKAWFYPGDNTGREFAYPKTREVLLSSNGTADTSYSNAVVAHAGPAPAGTLNSNEENEVNEVTESAMTPAPVQAVDHSDEATAPVALTDEGAIVADMAADEPSPVADQDQAQRPTETTPNDPMPKTASQFAVYGLFGLGSLAAAYGMRKRTS